MTEPTVPKPGPRPGPRPGSGPGLRPGSIGARHPGSRPTAAGAQADAAGPDPASWGRVDVDGSVYVRTADGERRVGQWPGGDPGEALTLYTRRFDELALEVDLLDRRVRTGSVSPEEARSSVARVRAEVSDAQAVGDLDALTARLEALSPVIEEQRQQRKAARAARLDGARADKEALVVDAEQVATGRDWRAGTDRMRVLMDRWQTLPRLEKSVDDQLWRRLSAARTSYTRQRRQHYSEQHEQRLAALEIKQGLATEAETLASSTQWGPTAGRFRELMRRWKAAGPAPHREEEALWSRFRGAQDGFFSARAAASARTDAELGVNAEVKRAILVEAEALVPVTDLAAARAALRNLAERWDAAGQAPREMTTELEARMRAVETAMREAQDHRWQRSNPEARARAQAAVAQLEASLERLRADAVTARAAADDRGLAESEQAILARESWLVEARRALVDFS